MYKSFDFIFQAMMALIGLWLGYSYIPKLIKRIKIKRLLEKETIGYPSPQDINPPNSPEK